MIPPSFLEQVLDLMLDGTDISPTLRQQIPYLIESESSQTNQGLFISFMPKEGAYNFRAEDPNLVLHGLVLTSKDMEGYAMINLFFTFGVVSSIEVWAPLGNWPQTLDNYTLSQNWEGAPQRQIVVGKG
jgi:hypothetical protein